MVSSTWCSSRRGSRGCDMKMPVFNPQGEWCARLEITEMPAAAFAMRSTGVLHDLGFAEASAYYLLEAPSTDDAWKIGVRERARWIEVGDDYVDDALSRW